MKGGEKSLKSDGDGGTRHERISPTKEDVAKRLYEWVCQCLVVRFEERAKECNKVARLTTNMGSRSESNTPATCKGEGRRIQVRGVTGLRPETR